MILTNQQRPSIFQFTQFKIPYTFFLFGLGSFKRNDPIIDNYNNGILNKNDKKETIRIIITRIMKITPENSYFFDDFNFLMTFLDDNC